MMKLGVGVCSVVSMLFLAGAPGWAQGPVLVKDIVPGKTFATGPEAPCRRQARV